MFLINYDFYDLHELFCTIRSLPDNSCYIPALQAIKSYLIKPAQTNMLGGNIIRNLIRPYVNKEDNILQWSFVNNYYTANVRIIKDESIYAIIIEVITEIEEVMKENDPQKLFLLADAVHNIPCTLVDDEKPKKRITGEISKYRNNFNSNFLIKEIKKIR